MLAAILPLIGSCQFAYEHLYEWFPQREHEYRWLPLLTFGSSSTEKFITLRYLSLLLMHLLQLSIRMYMFLLYFTSLKALCNLFCVKRTVKF